MPTKLKTKTTPTRGRYYKPRSYRTVEEDLYWRKKLILSILGVSLLLGLLWFGGVLILSHLDAFWGALGRERNQAIGPSGNSDIFPPSPPTLINPPAATKENRIKLEGKAEKDSEIILFLNNKPVEKTFADEKGSFTFEGISLSDGENRFSLTAKDKSGNESGKSPFYTINYNKKAPELDLENPKDGTILNGKNEQTITVTGTVSPSSVTLTINDIRAIVNEDGTFSLRISLDRDGENKITVKATDDAGNSTEKSVTVTYNEEKDD